MKKKPLEASKVGYRDNGEEARQEGAAHRTPSGAWSLNLEVQPGLASRQSRPELTACRPKGTSRRVHVARLCFLWIA